MTDLAPSLRTWTVVVDDSGKVTSVDPGPVIASWADMSATPDSTSPPTRYVVVSPDDVILNTGFEGEIARAVSDPALDGVTWTALVSNGVDISGSAEDTGNYPDRPATPTRRPPRIIAASQPAIAVVDLQAIAETALTPANTFTDLCRNGLGRGRPVFSSSALRFSRLSDAPPMPEMNETVEFDPSQVRNDPSIQAVIRTAGNRPRLLARSIASLAAADVDRVTVAGVVEDGSLDRLIEPMTPDGLDIHTLTVPESTLPARTSTMLAAIEQTTADYVWFVDDDDIAVPNSATAIKAVVHTRELPLIVGRVIAYNETWAGADLVSRVRARTWIPAEWHRAFTGWNHLPNCALVIPTDRARARLEVAPLADDLGEDFALQLLMLTAPNMSVEVIDRTIAEVSWRGEGDNAVAASDRTAWMRDVSSHIARLADDDRLSNEALWRLGRDMGSIPYPWDPNDTQQ